MKLADVLNIEELHQAAKRRTPRAVFDYFEGGVEDEMGMARNESIFRAYQLLPRYLVDVSSIDQHRNLFGRRYPSPFGIAPTAAQGYLRPGADLMMAGAAAAANLPYVMSGLSTESMEAAAKIAGDRMWYQLYGAKDRKISRDMIRRATDCGLGGLVLTVDVPVGSKRERELRNKIYESKVPLRNKLEALTHPAWLWDYMTSPAVEIKNWRPYFDPKLSADGLFQAARTQFPVSDQTWADVEDFRKLFAGKFLLKGILHPEDAKRAQDAGVDGIFISNHGGRQLDRGPTAIEMLPAIKAAAPKLTLLFDGGVRRGSDILTALALGADFIFVGRAALYGVAAFGQPGVQRAIQILQSEIEITMKQLGTPTLEHVGPHVLRKV
ncbi:MAG TPA: alpha-hydroxy acid oxidase [bacterium]